MKLKRAVIVRAIAGWQSRTLFLVGRITVAKSLLLLQATHVIASLPNPRNEFMKQKNKVLFAYVWNFKRNPLKRTRICHSVQQNGLAMLDFRAYVKSLKMKWMKRLMVGNDSSWSSFVPKAISSKCI